uniref:Mitochondrial import receptor subunit TOM7 homolog n=1 Tax=Amphiprion ocellaris TaxID=80972 RepID=A0AAQ6AEG7_AMPOC
MAKLSKETKQRLQQLFQCGQFVIRWGFIPTVLYLGFKRGADPGMPEPSVLRVNWWKWAAGSSGLEEGQQQHPTVDMMETRTVGRTTTTDQKHPALGPGTLGERTQGETE